MNTESAEETVAQPVTSRNADALLLRDLAPRIRELSRLQVWRGPCAIAADWSIIVACFVLAWQAAHPLAWIGAGLIVATRQHALLTLMHEAAHWRL
ncbi:MAG: hypothetical protein AB7K24_31950, partial [Gemmataceae bacterium]